MHQFIVSGIEVCTDDIYVENHTISYVFPTNMIGHCAGSC
jgi:hypothetical protein